MQFLFQPLTWGFVLVGVPILVHLINMLRHRKQSWAAMDFLMESYRKHRRWVLLKQWLLLAARILAMFLLVAMLASWISNSQSLGWFGGRVTHHYILLDDSFSMAEQEKDETAYGRALKAVQSLIRSIASQPGDHQLTLLRWSRAELAARAGKEQAARVDVAADLISQTIPQDASRLLDRVAASQPSSLQLSPDPALELIAPLVSANQGEQVEIYVVTDLRRNEWAQPESTKSRLAPLVAASSRVQFIDCAEPSSGNLGLSSLQPEQETWAAGVPLMVKFQVTNHGQAPAKNVVVKLRSINYAEGSVTSAPEAKYSGEIADAPPVVIDEIPAGETAMRQVQLVFATPGQHVVEATLPEDRLQVDNHRWCVIGIRQTQEILVIDDSADVQTQFFLKTALQPGGQATGMSVDVRDAAYLRDATADALANWDAVVLLEGPTLDPAALGRLENYIKAGGGLAFISGPSTTPTKVNEYYRGGAGFFPATIAGSYETNIRPGNTEPQVVATDHPILAPLKSLQTSPFQLIEVRKMLEFSSNVESDPTVEVVAWGPDKKPLIVDKTYGDGHVVIVLTGLVSDAAGGGRLLNADQKVAWSNWAQDPTFVVFALRTMGYLGSFRRAETSEPVGAPITTTFAGTTLLPGADLLLPAKNDNARAKLSLPADQPAPDQPVKLTMGVDLTQDNDAIEGLLRPGVFEFWMQTTDGASLVRNTAHNVPAGEGNLARVLRSELEEKLSPIKIKVQSAESLSSAAWSPEAASYSTLLFALLVLLLLAEQSLAYSASYHVPKITKPGVGVA